MSRELLVQGSLMRLLTPLKGALLGPLHLPSLPSSHSLTSQYAQQALVSIDLSLFAAPFCGAFRDTSG